MCAAFCYGAVPSVNVSGLPLSFEPADGSGEFHARAAGLSVTVRADGASIRLGKGGEAAIRMRLAAAMRRPPPCLSIASPARSRTSSAPTRRGGALGSPVAGSFWLLVSIVPLLVLLPLGLGLLIAAAARNHSHAIQMGNLILTPSILLSGFVFPREFLHFPFDEISRVLPTTYFVSLSRDIILRGTPAADLIPAMAWTAGLALVLLPAGYFALRRSLAV